MATSPSQDGLACSSSPSYLASAPSRSLAIRAAAEDEASSFASALRPSKDRKRATLVRSSVAADTDADTIDIRVHGNHRRGAGLMNRRLLSSTNQGN
ncbi:hypothetical protein Cni_G24801 [Canna indica]|uniref:Uncharacterized protein n=1 Tax=Canna indica TaxID=4628 RepID=A0AAQ3QLT3_9LILI|nr:hypothetical protein Cni_G24801 [Canna indica]